MVCVVEMQSKMFSKEYGSQEPKTFKEKVRDQLMDFAKSNASLRWILTNQLSLTLNFPILPEAPAKHLTGHLTWNLLHLYHKFNINFIPHGINKYKKEEKHY